MNSRLAAMIWKEFSQLGRDVPILIFVIWAFTGAVYTGGHGIATEIHNYPLVILDLSRSLESRELLSRFRAPYFKVVGYASRDEELVTMLDAGQASLA
ncbi:MAG TPA: ABC transporter permease, partial [Methylomirabilota bacterium]|nr:ABC transporter permease [Methylomirabilota bacterium]